MIPTTGWRCTNVADLGEGADAKCEMCGNTGLRYVHTMVHPDHPVPLDVGGDCAGQAESNPEAPAERERIFRNKDRRLKAQLKREAEARDAAERWRQHQVEHWLARPWAPNRVGNDALEIEGWTVGVREAAGAWQWWVKTGPRTAQFSESTFDSEAAAKIGLHDQWWESEPIRTERVRRIRAKSRRWW